MAALGKNGGNNVLLTATMPQQSFTHGDLRDDGRLALSPFCIVISIRLANT